MEDHSEKKQPRVNECAALMDKDKRKCERRKRECEGYAYIEMVGWIDRREKLRRDDDCFSD